MTENQSKMDSESSSADSLLIENIKLRKLLSLQQKAIAYRHSLTNSPLNSYSFTSDNRQFNAQKSDQNNNHFEDAEDNEEEVSQNTTIAMETFTDERNSMSFQNGTSVKIECIFCPKVFSSALNYSRHLSLKHLTATANSDLWISPFKTLELLHSALNSTSVSSSLTEKKTQHTSDSINSSQESKILEELSSLRERLQQTENELIKEKQARVSLEENLKTQIQNLNSRKSEVPKNDVSHKPDEPSPQSSIQKTIVPSLPPASPSPKLETESSQISDNQKSDKKLTTLANFKDSIDKLIEEKLKDTENLNERKDNVTVKEEKEARRINGGIDKKESKKVKFKSDIENNTKSIEKEKGKETINEDVDDEKEETEKEEKKFKVEKIVEDRKESIEENSGHIRDDVESSLSLRLSQYMSDREKQISPKLDDGNYNKAMEQIQRDRDLLIQQTRYDYDFQDIETSLRDMIDSRVKQKLQNNDSPLSSPPPIISPKPETDKSSNNSPSLATENNTDKDKVISLIKEQMNIENELNGIDKSALKSILSTAMKKRNRPPSSKRRITFSDQVVEFPFFKGSPIQSDNEDDSSGGREDRTEEFQPLSTSTNRKNQMFIIREMNDKQEKSFPLPGKDYNQINGEKIYMNESTSSSSEEDELTNENIPKIVPKTIPGKIPRPTTLASIASEPTNSKTDAIAELLRLKLQERENISKNNFITSSTIEDTANKSPTTPTSNKLFSISPMSLNGLSVGKNDSPEKYDIYDF